MVWYRFLPIFFWVASLALGYQTVVQTSAVIARCNLSWYYLKQCNVSSRTSIRFRPHKRHPISSPHERPLLWGFWRKNNRVITVSHCIWVNVSYEFSHNTNTPKRRITQSCIFMMTSSNGNFFRVTGLSCREFTGYRWIPHTKARDAELWCFLWSEPK